MTTYLLILVNECIYIRVCMHMWLACVNVCVLDCAHGVYACMCTWCVCMHVHMGTSMDMCMHMQVCKVCPGVGINNRVATIFST